jgi:hypothetical protein
MREQALVLLAEAERLYGPRDATYRFAGVTFDPGGPNLWYSLTSDEIWIKLSPSTIIYPDQARHQLAHEVIHLLAPNRSPTTVMLEEGLAVHFSVYAPTFFTPTYRLDTLKHLSTSSEARNYLDALSVYNELVAIEPNAIVGSVIHHEHDPTGQTRIGRTALWTPTDAPDWLKMKNADAPAVKREAEEEWGKKKRWWQRALKMQYGCNAKNAFWTRKERQSRRKTQGHA